MENKLFLSIAAGLGLTLSFGLLSFKSGNTADTPASYHYGSVKLTSTYKFDHPAPGAAEAFARVVYPIFRDNKLNNIITSAVLSPLKVKYDFQNTLAAEHPTLSNMDAINTGAAGYPELGHNFLQQFEAQASQDDFKAYWYADIHVKVLAEKQDYTALLCEKDYFTGGLHDLYDHIYLNYDNRNHQLITLNSQFKPNMQNELKVIAERIFRKNEGLASTQELDGYFFKDDQFNLPANFTITDQGLLFFYDYYEIKPFAAGTTQLVIPFADLKDLVLPNSVLADQMDKK
ncbi:RsiV family protein [Mucilaginibacter sp. dw_454]|uniref:RsiV family protein n=1 Tax=Mucilaginibacter sp. dw_454 TaxID=2720079 RepID=UPI001BD40DB4|nr:RsiV family protein [Mucilaginibacter sp. dw_454]